MAKGQIISISQHSCDNWSSFIVEYSSGYTRRYFIYDDEVIPRFITSFVNSANVFISSEKTTYFDDFFECYDVVYHMRGCLSHE